MGEAPPGFCRRSEEGALLVLRADVADALVAAGFADPERVRAAADSRYDGRGQAFGVEVDRAGRVFVRPYLHGGLLGRVAADRYAGDSRFRAEVTAMLDAAAAGVPVPEPLGFVTRPAGMGLVKAWFLAREVEGGEDLLAFLEASPSPALRRVALGLAGAAMRALHDAGFDHPDLHMKNLLVTPDHRVLVLDLDRTRRRDRLSRRRRIAALFRFDRHAAKQVRAGSPVSRSDRLRVLRAYAGGDWPEREQVRELAGQLSRHIARHQVLRRPAAANGAER